MSNLSSSLIIYSWTHNASNHLVENRPSVTPSRGMELKNKMDINPLTPKRCILYIYSTSIGTEHFKHGIYSSFFSLQNAVCFIILTYLVPVLFALYIYIYTHSVLKLKK